MGNTIKKKKCVQIINLKHLEDIINHNFGTFQMCQFNKFLIRISKLTNEKSICKNIIFIACDIYFFLYIKEQLESLNYNEHIIHFIISYPCYLTFSIFEINGKISVAFEDATESMCKLIGFILQNLPVNINILIISYNTYCRCIKQMNNFPCSLELVQIKKIFGMINIFQNIKLPHNCQIKFV